ncbi:hypothetical protein G9A89_003901 [Geosiphon pyriformis]|nr:hypothetical protein G9A89_003901 [Geosiphon pyriformis]
MPEKNKQDLRKLKPTPIASATPSNPITLVNSTEESPEIEIRTDLSHTVLGMNQPNVFPKSMTKLMHKDHNGLTCYSGILENRNRLTKPILENKTLAQSSANQNVRQTSKQQLQDN